MILPSAGIQMNKQLTFVYLLLRKLMSKESKCQTKLFLNLFSPSETFHLLRGFQI